MPVEARRLHSRVLPLRGEVQITYDENELTLLMLAGEVTLRPSSQPGERVTIDL